MKKLIPIFLLTLFCFSLRADEIEQTSVVKEEATVEIDKVSETLGFLLIKQLNNPVFAFNIEKIIEGMRGAQSGQTAPLTEAQYEEQILVIQEKIFHKNAEKNLSEAVAFLEKNGQEEGVISVSPQLQYKVSQRGGGEQEVVVDGAPLIHYSGKLLDGTVFASSTESGTPITLPIKEAIVGFSKGLIGMKKGEKRTLYIHPELAYGVASHLPPNSLLIFDVEVVETTSATAAVEVEGNIEPAEAA